MKSKNRLSLLLITLLIASIVLPCSLAQTTDRNQTPNQQALNARYTHNELMLFAISLFDNVDSTYDSYKENIDLELSENEGYNSSELAQLLLIENFPSSENLQIGQRLEMEIDELIHFHRTSLTVYRQAVSYLIRDAEIPGSPTSSFVRDFKEIFYFQGMVLDTINSLLDRLSLDMNRVDFREPEPVIMHETTNSVILKRRTLFVLERIWLHAIAVNSDFGGRVESVLPSLNGQSKTNMTKESGCFCATN